MEECSISKSISCAWLRKKRENQKAYGGRVKDAYSLAFMHAVFVDHDLQRVAWAPRSDVPHSWYNVKSVTYGTYYALELESAIELYK
jgi:hypothetical protein